MDGRHDDRREIGFHWDAAVAADPELPAEERLSGSRTEASRSMHERLLSPYAAHTGAHETLPSARRGTSRL